MRSLALAAWVCLTMAGSMWAALHLGVLAVVGDAGHKPGRTEHVRLPPVSVPVLADGHVRGYVVARFTAITTDAEPGARIDLFVVDEIFRSIYSLGLRDLEVGEKSRLAELTKGIIQRLNERLGRPVVRELLVQEWAWVGKKNARH